jgi:hypothetical protein
MSLTDLGTPDHTSTAYIAVASGVLYAAAGAVYQRSGNEWVEVPGFPAGVAWMLTAMGGLLYVMVGIEGASHVYRFEGGSSWTDLGSFGESSIVAMCADATHVYIAVDDQHTYRYDGGTTWTDLGAPSENSILALAIHGGHLHIGSADGHVYRYSTGTTWTDLGAPTGGEVRALASCAGSLYAAPWDG